MMVAIISPALSICSGSNKEGSVQVRAFPQFSQTHSNAYISHVPLCFMGQSDSHLCFRI